jgi:GxxExxY protein
MIHEELSGKIIGAAMDVLNELRPSLDERLYERAMIIELKRRGHSLIFMPEPCLSGLSV